MMYSSDTYVYNEDDNRLRGTGEPLYEDLMDEEEQEWDSVWVADDNEDSF